MIDKIFLTGVSGTGYHGVFEKEKREGQLFVVDVEYRACPLCRVVKCMSSNMSSKAK
jgi:dihydroneopterin aldolase